MKTPISYYGGKQTLLPHILPLLETDHVCYCEPFFGGGAVFFAKKPSHLECINDTNDNLINFYRVLHKNFEELKIEIECSLHSRSLHRQAQEILRNSEKYDKIKRAWAFWAASAMSFGASLSTGWSFMVLKNGGSRSTSIHGKKKRFIKELSYRLKDTQIECDNAIEVIKRFNKPTTLFYLDPPYLNADQGHYSGWTEDNERELLELCSNIEGKFIHSNYPSELLTEYRERYGWNCKDIHGYVRVNNKHGKSQCKKKIECLTWNYQVDQLSLF